MKTFSFLHRALQLLLPATLLLASCGKDDKPAPAPVPDQGSILFINAAASTPVSIKAFVNNEEKATLAYGANTGGGTPSYQSVPTGTPSIKITNAAAASDFFTLPTVVAKDQKYSYFVYSNSSDGNVAPVGLSVLDDLAAPSSGKAKIRLVHVALNFPNPAGALNLSQTQPVGFLPLTSAVNFLGNSAFVEINAGPANLLLTTGSSPTGQTVGTVGDGTGTGTGAMNTGTKNYEAGKIYTIVVRGVAGNPDPARQPKAFIMQHN